MPQSTTIAIPASIDEAVDTLTGLGELITARKWERAAIVAAFVRLSPGRGQQHPDIANARSGISFESPEDFAARGIVGLSSRMSVTKYVQAWLDANDDKYPKPGSKRRLPNLDFPPMRTGTDGHSTPKGAADTVDEIFERHGVDTIVESLSETQVEAVVEAATRARPRTTMNTVARVRAETIPDTPFDTPPDAFPGAKDSEARMDILRDLANLHHNILLQARHVREHPDFMSEQADELTGEADLLRMVAEAARGMTADDLDALLSGGLS